MRSTAASAFLLACLVLAGCTSSASVDDILQRPSMEVTSSIKPDAAAMNVAAGPTPPADVAAEPAAFVATARPASPLGEAPQRAVEREAVEPSVQTAAMVVPDRPKTRPLRGSRQEIYQRRFRDAKPINFGKASPRAMAVHGVDVSRWQGDIDWPKLRSQGANFAYIKATDGGDHLDPMFRKNWREAGQAGLRRGAYHFFYWCRAASEQADWFIRNVPKVDGSLPPVIDVEYNGESRCKRRLSRERVIEKMTVFMNKLEAHYGQRPVIYTAPDFYRDNLRGAFEDYPFWLRAVAQHPSKVYPGRKWVFWQYSGSGLSHGVAGKIDLNVFNGSEAQWHAWIGRNAGS